MSRPLRQTNFFIYLNPFLITLLCFYGKFKYDMVFPLFWHKSLIGLSKSFNFKRVLEMNKLVYLVGAFIFIVFTGCAVTDSTQVVAPKIIKNTSQEQLINKKYRTLNVEELISINEPFKIIKKYVKYIKCDEYAKKPFVATDCRLSRKTDYKNIDKVLKYLVSVENKIVNKKEKAFYYKNLAYLFSLLNDDYQAVYYLKKSLNIDNYLCKNVRYSLNKSSYCVNLNVKSFYSDGVPLLYDYYELGDLSANLDDSIFYYKKAVFIINKFSPVTNLKKLVRTDPKLSYKIIDKKSKYLDLLNKKLELYFSLVYLYKEKKDYKKAGYYLKKAYDLDKNILNFTYYSYLHSRDKDYSTISSVNEYKEELIKSKLNYLINKARIYSEYDRKKAIKTYLDYYKTWKSFGELKKKDEILLVKTKYDEPINKLKKYKYVKNKKSYQYLMNLTLLGVTNPSQIDKKITELEYAKKNELIKIEKKYSYLKNCKSDSLYYACVRDFYGLLSYLEFFKLANVVNKDEFLINLLKYIERNKLYYQDFYMFSVNYKPYLYYSFGEYFFEEGNYKLSFSNLINAAENKNNYNNYIFNGEYYYMLGVSAQKLGYYADALKFYEKSIKEMNKDIIRLSTNEQKKLIEKNKNIIANMIDSAIEAKKTYQDINGALFEKAINYSLNYKNSLFEIEDYIASLYYKTNDFELKSLIRSYFNLKRKLNENYIKNKDTKDLENQIKVVYNQILFYKPYKTTFVRREDVAKNLKDDELFVNIIYSNKRYYIFYFDHEDNFGWKIFNEKNSFLLNKKIKIYQKLVKQLKRNPYNARIVRQKNKITNQIYNDLFGFLINDKNMSFKKYKKIIIFSDGLLRLISFGELYDFHNKKYLIEEKEISYVPSAKFLLDKSVNKQIKNAIIFAAPDFNKGVGSKKFRGSGIITINDLFRGMKFSPLPGTLKEAKELQAIFNINKLHEKIYLKKQANVYNLLSINSPTILHIATHGFYINSDKVVNPMLKSGIALSGANKTKEGIVTALKITGLDLDNTNLVVLSACETGVVDLKSTDNVSALNKSFLLAGAKNVISTLWEINDNETVNFMKLFYKEYLKTNNVSEALRNTKIKFINDYKSSVYWAPFICFEK